MLKCNLIPPCCGHAHILCFTLPWNSGFISWYALKRFGHRDRDSHFYNPECSVGFSGVWRFFPLTSAVLDFSKSEGAEKIILSLSINR